MYHSLVRPTQDRDSWTTAVIDARNEYAAPAPGKRRGGGRPLSDHPANEALSEGMSVKILIMGGTRFVGLACVEELAKFGHDVTIFNRGVTEAPVALPRNIRRLYGDRNDHDALRATLKDEKFDAVVDCSAYLMADVELMVEIFKGRIGHYIFMSSPAAFAPSTAFPIPEDHPGTTIETPRNKNYGILKAACEQYLVDQFYDNGFPASVGKLPMVFGPRNTGRHREALMMHRLLLGRPALIPGDGSTFSHPNYIPDMAIGVRKMLLNPATFGQKYTWAMEEYYSDDSFADVIGAVVGVTPDKIYMPADVTTEVYQTFPYPIMHRSQLAASPWYKSNVFSTTKFFDHTGFRQEHTFEAACADTYEWFQRAKIHENYNWDFSHEDAIIKRIRG